MTSASATSPGSSSSAAGSASAAAARSATLPLLAAFLYEDAASYSPYGPASRLFWNELFVDPRRLPELARSPEAQRLLASDALRREVAQLSAGSLIDYGRVAALKRRVLAPLAAAFFAKGSPEERRAALADLRERRPELDAYAAFRAATERFDAPWQEWPQALRGAGAAGGALDPDAYDGAAYRFHLYAQLAAEEQVASAAEAAGGLYLDLPLGVLPSSFDAWRQPELFVTGATAGAPPDPLFSLGQDWGFHPIHPQRQRRDGYRHLRAVLRHHLAHARMLRIDHVMQLHRLFWIPRGVDKRDGVYVRYPAEELYAILSLESHRARARVVGENLGTVPRYVDRALSRHGVLKMYVLPFEVDGSLPRGRLHRPVPDDAVASVDTHDMPTFRAFWEGADVDDRRDLGLLDAREAAAEMRGREGMRALWRRGLAASGHLRPRPGAERGAAGSAAGSVEILSAALASLGESASPLVLVNLEDLWGELAPQNVPGTWHERPNWRRRAALTLEEIATDPAIRAVLDRLDAARRGDLAASAPAGTASATLYEDRRAPDHQTGRNPMSDDKTPAVSRSDPSERGGTAVAEAPAEGAGEAMRPVPQRSLLSDDDLHLFNEGRHFRLYTKLGAHRRSLDGSDGYNFAVWAPDAEGVSVVGDFNGWNRDRHPLAPRGSSGIWEGFLPGVEPGRPLQVPRALPLRWLPGGQGRSVRGAQRGAAEDRLGALAPRLRVGGRRLDGLPRRARRPRRAGVDLRGPPRLLAPRAGGRRPLPDLPRGGRAARRPLRAPRLHPRRAAADHGAPVLRLVGLPDHRLLRADRAATARPRT